MERSCRLALRKAASAPKKWVRDNPGAGVRPSRPRVDAALRGARYEALRRTTMRARVIDLGLMGHRALVL